jgi:hypothetical protein
MCGRFWFPPRFVFFEEKEEKKREKSKNVMTGLPVDGRK